MHPSMDRWPRCSHCGREDGPVYHEGVGPQVCHPCARSAVRQGLAQMEEMSVVALVIAVESGCERHPSYALPCLACRLEGEG